MKDSIEIYISREKNVNVKEEASKLECWRKYMNKKQKMGKYEQW